MTPIERQWEEMTPPARHAESRRLGHALTDALGDIYLWLGRDPDRVLKAVAGVLLSLRYGHDCEEPSPLVRAVLDAPTAPAPEERAWPHEGGPDA